MPQISRFQAQAINSRIYIHTHRSLQDVLVLDVSDSDAPTLSLQPVSSDPEPPMSRQTPSLQPPVPLCWSVALKGPPFTFDSALRMLEGRQYHRQVALSGA